MFQAKSSFTFQLAGQFPLLSGYGPTFGLILAGLVGVVIIGGIRSIANVTEKIVPFMAILYVGTLINNNFNEYQSNWKCFFFNFQRGFLLRWGLGGIVGVLIQGFRRAAFSNEAGVGSASITFCCKNQ